MSWRGYPQLSSDIIRKELSLVLSQQLGLPPAEVFDGVKLIRRRYRGDFELTFSYRGIVKNISVPEYDLGKCIDAFSPDWIRPVAKAFAEDLLDDRELGIESLAYVT